MAFKFSTIDLTKLLQVWGKLTMGKMAITVLLGCLAYTTWYCRDTIKHAADVYVTKLEGTQVQTTKYDPEVGLPSTIEKTDIMIMEQMMRAYVSSDQSIYGMIVYEFVPKGSEMLYQGRVLIASVAQNGRDLGERYNAKWLPIGSDRKQMERILRGDVFWRPPTHLENLADENAKSMVNMRLLQRDGAKFMLSVPIVDANYQVRGYITLLMTVNPTEEEREVIIRRLEDEAVEYSRFLQS